MPRWFSFRTIVEDPGVTAACDEHRRRLVRFGQAYDALQWRLARRAETMSGWTRVEAGNVYHLYRQGGDELAQTPDITIVFRIEEHQVVIAALRATPAAPAVDDVGC